MTICLEKFKKIQWAIWEIADGFSTVMYKSPLTFAKAAKSCLTIKVLFINKFKMQFFRKNNFQTLPNAL